MLVIGNGVLASIAFPLTLRNDKFGKLVIVVGIILKWFRETSKWINVSEMEK